MMGKRFETTLELARRLDELDKLAPFRKRFLFADPELIYLDGNSLGRLPSQVRERIRQVVELEWGKDLIRGWNAGWYEAPARVGEKIASIVGASQEQLIVSDSTSVNLFKLVLAGLAIRGDRMGIVTDALNFPSDLYVLQGCVHILGDRHHLQVIPSTDGITIDQQTLLDSID